MKNRKYSAGYSGIFSVAVALVFSTAFAGSVRQRNLPPACDPQTKTCSICPTGEVTTGCIKINLDMGVSTPWTGSIGASLRVFADDASPLVFTAESIHPVFGYTFKRLGNRVLSDGVTAKDVVFSHPAGEPVTFTFEEGESLGRPDPGVHVPMNERLMMVDAQGWACTHDPVYYDLYLDDGRVRRFRAALGYAGFGAFVSEKDSRGVTVTAADMGFDIVYGPDGVRQFLTPSRLADVRVCADGYDIAVYPVQTAPAKDSATGLYALPAVGTVKFLSLRSAKGGKEAVVTLRSGDAEAKVYRFEYLREDWSLTRPDGIREDNSRAIEDSVRARISKEVRSPSGVVLSHEDMNYVYRPWGYAMTHRVEGFGTATRTTAWDYVANGDGRGLIRMRLDPTGLKTEYNYDPVGRKLAETRSGPGMMTEVTTFSYEAVDPSDAVPPVDARPRTVVRTLNGIECERTYYVYSPLTNIVERVGVQGAAFGGTNALRTVTTFYPIVAGDLRSGMVRSVRHEDK